MPTAIEWEIKLETAQSRLVKVIDASMVTDGWNYLSDLVKNINIEALATKLANEEMTYPYERHWPYSAKTNSTAILLATAVEEAFEKVSSEEQANVIRAQLVGMVEYKVTRDIDGGRSSRVSKFDEAASALEQRLRSSELDTLGEIFSRRGKDLMRSGAFAERHPRKKSVQETSLSQERESLEDKSVEEQQKQVATNVTSTSNPRSEVEPLTIEIEGFDRQESLGDILRRWFNQALEGIANFFSQIIRTQHDNTTIQNMNYGDTVKLENTKELKLDKVIEKAVTQSLWATETEQSITDLTRSTFQALDVVNHNAFNFDAFTRGKTQPLTQEQAHTLVSSLVSVLNDAKRLKTGTFEERLQNEQVQSQLKAITL